MYETSKIHEIAEKRQKRSPGSSILFLIWQNMVLRCTTVLHIWMQAAKHRILYRIMLLFYTLSERLRCQTVMLF